MLESISIKRFKSLKEIKIDDFKQFNLIVGKNNSGKTNLIESLYQSINPGNASLLGKVNLWKGLDVIDPEIWKTVFYKLDLTNNVEIKSKIDINSRETILEIKPLFDSEIIDIENRSQNHKEVSVITKDSTSMDPDSIRGLSLHLYYKENNKKSKDFISTIFSKKLNIDPLKDLGKIFSPYTINNDKNYDNVSNGKIINSETILLDLWKRFKRIAIKKKKQPIIEILKQFDANLIDLELIGQTIYADLGYNEEVPISVMGYGFLKTLAFLVDLSNDENFIFAIDEIENGLHYSNLKIMWNALFTTAKLHNNQIIATTHSIECIKAFVNSYLSDDDNLRVFRVERKSNDDYKVTKYNKEDVDTYIENDWEIR